MDRLLGGGPGGEKKGLTKKKGGCFFPLNTTGEGKKKQRAFAVWRIGEQRSLRA